MVDVGLIYLGNAADLDPTEGNSYTENKYDLIGTYGNDVLQFTTVTVDDNSDGVAEDDDHGAGDSVSYDLGSGPVVSTVDSTTPGTATVTLGDGSTITTDIVVTQFTNGDIFLTELGNSGDLDGLSIRSIRIDTVDASNLAGWYVSQSVEPGNVVCFLEGTLIDTADGPTPVEQLSVGDQVLTRDRGRQTIRWINCQQVIAADRCAPVRIQAGALGKNNPGTTLMVSQQHRILVRNPVVERMFGMAEGLVPAKFLDGMEGISIESSGKPVTYYHFACDHHEIVTANGAEAETLYLGPNSLEMLGSEAVRELGNLLPGLDLSAPPPLARVKISGSRGRRFVERVQRNKKPLVMPL